MMISVDTTHKSSRPRPSNCHRIKQGLEISRKYQSVCTKTPRFPHSSSLAHTGSSCLLRCHDYIATCAGAPALNVCAFIITCLRPHHIQHPLYYCAFIWGTSNICVWGGTAKGHRVREVSNTLLHKSKFEREITLVD